MKQYQLHLFALLVMALATLFANAHSFEKNGIYYRVNGTDAIVTYRGSSYTSYSNEYTGDITIPAVVSNNGISYPVTKIDNYTFYNCNGLAKISIPNSIIEIGYNAFDGCTSLSSVNISDIAAWCRILFYSNPLNTAHHLYINGSQVTDLEIPNSVTSIGEYAFLGCTSLASVIIPNSVNSIGKDAFKGCSGLTSVNISNSVTYISEYAFQECSGLTSINIPNSVTSIGEYAFQGCTSLASVIIPNSVTSIGNCAFDYCYALTSVTIPSSVTSIGKFAFSSRGLKSVTCLAMTPPTINEYTFCSVTDNATLYVPRESVTDYQSADYWKNFSQIVGLKSGTEFEVDGVWYRAVDENTAMVISRTGDDDLYSGDMVIPEEVTYEGYTFTVTAIDAGAFEDCYELNSIVIGDVVESIGENAFQGCTELASVTIGSGVTSIGAKAFNYCNALQTVTCEGSVPPVMENSNCFSNAAYSRAVLRVPRQALETYVSTDYWYKFNNIEGFGSIGVGDVNADGVISITDVTALIGMVLGSGEYNADADMNYNGMLDIGDVTSLIVIILHQ